MKIIHIAAATSLCVFSAACTTRFVRTHCKSVLPPDYLVDVRKGPFTFKARPSLFWERCLTTDTQTGCATSTLHGQRMGFVPKNLSEVNEANEETVTIQVGDWCCPTWIDQAPPFDFDFGIADEGSTDECTFVLSAPLSQQGEQDR